MTTVGCILLGGGDMSYQTVRGREIRDSYTQTLRDFAATYRPRRKTVVFIPGGMGSQLDRSDRKFDSTGSNARFRYDAIWMDEGLLLSKDGLKLEILDDARDKGSHIIVPNGPLRFLFADPYDRTERFFRDKNYNYVVFGFDWRRSLRENAEFLERFLKQMRKTVRARCGEDPIPETTLVCHSLGGLVAKLFLNRARVLAADINGVVTVATPFYGTSNHMRRYYQGEKPLNLLHGKRKVTKLISTLPGPYILMFLDQETYRKDKVKLGLNQYPIRDSKTDAAADPYDKAMFTRYPKWMQVPPRTKFLHQARRVRVAITAPLPAAVKSKVFHLRAVRVKTDVEIFWKDIDGKAFDPDKHKLPLSGAPGKGDGIVPWWSARLAGTPDRQVFDLKTTAKHVDLLEIHHTLDVVHRIITNGVIPGPQDRTAPDKTYGGARRPMGRSKVHGVLRAASDGQLSRSDPALRDPALWRAIAREVTPC